MYAIIATGGKQYKVSKDSIIEVEKLNIPAGKEVVFNEVLLACDGEDIKVGQPDLKGAKVTGVLLREIKSEKTIAFKTRRRKSSSTRIGHRQKLAVVKIKEISL